MPPELPRSRESGFSLECRRCARLVAFLAENRQRFPGYHCLPVPSFGDPEARLLVVGLAPGLHGANATGRPFTGDHAGILLYETLFEFGFATRATSAGPDDALRLDRCRITNAVRCVPPANRPSSDEVRACNGYLRDEIRQLPGSSLILALGRIAHDATLRALELVPSRHRFGHGCFHDLYPGLRLLDSYHCSRYNTQTGRLTTAMFRQVISAARTELDAGAA